MGYNMNLYNETIESYMMNTQEVINWCRGVVWDEIQTTEQHNIHVDFVRTVNGVNIYREHMTDTFLFEPTQSH